MFRRPTRDRTVSTTGSTTGSAVEISKPVTRAGKIARRMRRAIAAGASFGHSYAMEPLENRTLLTTITSFGQLDAFGNPLAGEFMFYTGQKQVALITYADVNFEMIAAFVSPIDGSVTLGDPVPASKVEPTVGGNIYKIYVTESNADSYITITTLARFPLDTDTGVLPTPFAGTIPPLKVTNAQTGQPYTAVSPGGIGGILIGAVNLLPVAIAGTPISGIPLGTAYGLQPAPATGVLNPGIEVAPINPDTGEQNNFGKFLLGGAVTGSVNFGGNLNEFYAGEVLTGDINGDLSTPLTAPTSLRTAPDNFHVAGDLRQFITTGPVGTTAADLLVKDPSSIGYVTSFDLSVGGKIGEVHVGSGFAGTIEAGNSPYIAGQLSYPAGSTSTVLGDFDVDTEIEADPAENPDYSFIGDALDPPTLLDSADPYDPASLTQTPVDPAVRIPNDTLGAAQILGSIAETDPVSGLPVKDADGNVIYESSVDGTLDNEPPAADQVDTYAVALLGGVTADVVLSVANSIFTGLVGTPLARVEVVDPDGRIIASDSRTTGTEFSFTTDRPGLYRFQVSVYTTATSILMTAVDYNLTIGNVGNMAIGGIYVGGDFNDIGVDSAIIAGNGDIGVIQTIGTYVSTTLGPTPATAGITLPTTVTPLTVAPTSILVASGNLRDLTSESLGFIITGALIDGPTLSVPNGSVGLIQSIGTIVESATHSGDAMDLMTQYDPNYLDLTTSIYKTDDASASAIGGYIQVIDSATLLYAEIATNAGIGTIRAARMNTPLPSHIDVNADNKGNDGIIDLVDVSGQFGLLGGGPEFVTNNGGNIRYLNVGGPIFLPSAFGGETDVAVVYPAGATDTFTDDSGAQFTFTSNGVVTTTITNNSNGTSTTTTTGPTISALSYPVLDKAGLVPISITSTGSMTLNGSGINGAGSSVDVANLSITGIGRPITVATSNSSTGVVTTTTDAFGNQMIAQPIPAVDDPAGVVVGPISDPTDEFLSITGPAKFNVLNVTATTSVAGNSPVEIANTTRGEVVNLTAPGLGQLIVNGNLGFATPVATPAAVYPRAQIQDGNTYPFVQQHTGVVIGTGFVISDVDPSSLGTTGDVVSISVGGAVGNVEAGGTIQSLIANSAQSSGQTSATPIAGQFDGIVGPILATRLLYVDVGQGLLPTGSGMVGFSGLYGTGLIGTVTNAGNLDSSIRGNIVSAEDDASEIGINAITVGDGSIIGSTIATIIDTPTHMPQFAETGDLTPIPIVVKENNTSFAPGQTNLIYDIGPITVEGNGGIIGTQVSTGSIASITVGQGGFGILTSDFDGQNNGRIGSVTASGYGIRNTFIRGVGYLGPVTATGNGGLIPVTAYPLDLRTSDVNGELDPYFGTAPNKQIDINAALGTTAAAPNIANVTDTGVIQDDTFNGLNDFAGLVAQKARTSLPLFSTNITQPIPAVANVPVLGTVFENSITFGGAIGIIRIHQVVDGLQITAGKFAGLALSTSVNRLGISVAGAISSVVERGNFGSFYVDPETGQSVPDSYINAGGPNGTIGLMRIIGNLNANVYATGNIGSITVTGDLLGSISAYGLRDGPALNSLHVFGGVRDGSLVLNGSVGSIIINGTLGTSAGSLSIAGNANLIEVGASRTDKNSALALDLFVAGTLKTLKVFGQITGTVHTGIDLTHLSVVGTGVTPNIITGNINVDGRLGTATVINGNVDSDIVVTGTVSSFTINNGSLLENASLQSQVGSIQLFRTTGGAASGMYGSLIALNGTNEHIDISGNVGDGVNAASISADSGNVFRIRGNIANNAAINTAFFLNQLRVNGSILIGATVTAHPLKLLKVDGVNNGTIIAI